MSLDPYFWPAYWTGYTATLVASLVWTGLDEGEVHLGHVIAFALFCLAWPMIVVCFAIARIDRVKLWRRKA